MEEKKEIKISLGTFSVLVVSIAILVLALIICLLCFFVTKPSDTANNNSQLSQSNMVSKNEISTESVNISTNSNENTNTNSTNTDINRKLPLDKEKQRAIDYILYEPSYNVSFKDIDLDKDLSLETKIRTDLTASQVSNYASTMQWSTLQINGGTIPYPSDWKVEKQTNSIESYRITGKALGKEANKENYGTNTDRVVEADFVIVIYEPIQCDSSYKTAFKNALLSGYDTNNGVHWDQLFIENDKVSVVDNYAFLGDDEDGNVILQKIRFITQKSDLDTYKILNIENHIIGEIKFAETKVY